MPIATLWHVSLRAIQDWWNDNCLWLAASLAYYTALSLAPLVLLIIGVVGFVLDRQQAIHQLTAQLEGLMGAAGRELVTRILTTTSPQERADAPCQLPSFRTPLHIIRAITLSQRHRAGR